MKKLEDLFHNLEEHGWFMADGFMPEGLTERLYESARSTWEKGSFRDAHIGSRQTELRDSAIRGDTTFWLDESSKVPAQREFFEWATAMQKLLNRHFYLGLKRYEFHFARYATGYGYQTHLDQHQGYPHREITLILYLNPQWDDQDGGELCMYCLADHTRETQRILPKHDRLVMFRSGRIPHAVLPCVRPRWSLTGWFRTDDPGVLLQGNLR